VEKVSVWYVSIVVKASYFINLFLKCLFSLGVLEVHSYKALGDCFVIKPFGTC
jgi:hypothetical protein